MDRFIERLILNRGRSVTHNAYSINWYPGWPALTGFPQVGGTLSYSEEINAIWLWHEVDVDVIKQQLVNMTNFSLILCI